ncbi:MAG: ABC transporter permease [bacterium]|nr:ABC transporter permease [bacterium]
MLDARRRQPFVAWRTSVPAVHPVCPNHPSPLASGARGPGRRGAGEDPGKGAQVRDRGLAGHRLRTALSALGVAIGVAAVILLTSLGEGTREYITAQFSQFGTSIIAVNPGKVETLGSMSGVLGGTTHKLTIDDAEALRQLPGVKHLVSFVMGQARVEGGGRGRSVFVFGVSHEAPATWSFGVGQGSFLPAIDPRRQGSHAVLGPKLARELFDGTSPLGKRVRIGGRSFLVIGVMESKGQMVGFDFDDTAYVPVASAMALFRVDELTEIDVLARSAEAIPAVVDGMRQILSERHRGEEDFTITTQQEMLDTFGRVISIVTVAVSGIAGISLLVGAIGILTIMWISVHERTNEIGVLRALGETPAGVARLFLIEAILIAAVGGVMGIAAGFGVGGLIRLVAPALPLSTPASAVVAALAMSAVVGAASGYLPARRAAGLDPVDALRAE